MQGADEAAIVGGRRIWQDKLAQAGLAGVTWPVQYGGRGLGPVEQVIVNQELCRAGLPGILDVIGVALSSPGGCSAASAMPPTASRESCSAPRKDASRNKCAVVD